MEELLQSIAALYRCLMPLYETPKFVLHELLSGTTKVLKIAKVKRLKLVPTGLPLLDPNSVDAWETIEIWPLFAAVSRHSTNPRNAGVHYSQPGLELADEEMEAFATAALALAKALTCPICFELPRKIVAGSYLGCNCRVNKMQLLPIQRP
ncbi:hypothetical protein A0257_04520 [Hymenobacter psoromatis]|nr:hypothetical protein A0257_04520 [Hymenobacter psoromatis]